MGQILWGRSRMGSREPPYPIHTPGAWRPSYHVRGVVYVWLPLGVVPRHTKGGEGTGRSTLDHLAMGQLGLRGPPNHSSSKRHTQWPEAFGLQNTQAEPPSRQPLAQAQAPPCPPVWSSLLGCPCAQGPCRLTPQQQHPRQHPLVPAGLAKPQLGPPSSAK